MSLSWGWWAWLLAWSAFPRRGASCTPRGVTSLVGPAVPLPLSAVVALVVAGDAHRAQVCPAGCASVALAAQSSWGVRARPSRNRCVVVVVLMSFPRLPSFHPSDLAAWRGASSGRCQGASGADVARIVAQRAAASSRTTLDVVSRPATKPRCCAGTHRGSASRMGRSTAVAMTVAAVSLRAARGRVWDAALSRRPLTRESPAGRPSVRRRTPSRSATVAAPRWTPPRG